MSYKVQFGTAYLAGQVTSSVGFSGSLIQADEFYGDGSNLINVAAGTTTETGTSTFYVPFVASATGADPATFYIDNGIQIQPSTSNVTLGTSGAYLSASILLIDSGSTIGGDVIPKRDSEFDLGTQIRQWAEAHIDAGYIDAITTAGITATANIDIGAYDFRANTILADDLTSGRVVFTTTNGQLTDDADMSFSGDTLTVTKLGAFEAAGAIDFSDEAMTNVNVDSGAIDGTAIGANSAASGEFDALTSSAGWNVAGGVRYSGIAYEDGAAVTLDADYNIVVCNRAGSAMTVSLPTTAVTGRANGSWYTIKRSGQMGQYDVKITASVSSPVTYIADTDSITLEAPGDSATLVYSNDLGGWVLI